MPIDLHMAAEGIAPRFRAPIIAKLKKLFGSKPYKEVMILLANFISALSGDDPSLARVIYSFANNTGSFLGRDWVATTFTVPFAMRGEQRTLLLKVRASVPRSHASMTQRCSARRWLT